jgi:hypothetical protein
VSVQLSHGCLDYIRAAGPDADRPRAGRVKIIRVAPIGSVVFYISGHGFGHASRQVEIINALFAVRPAGHVVVRTNAPRWLFNRSVTEPFTFVGGDTDTGVVQVDSLHVDAPASIAQAWAFHRRLDEHAATESALLAQHDARLVVGDVPALACAAARRAGIPAVIVSNFTWDWIYAHYARWLRDAPALVPTVRDAYRTADTALRLPMAGGFEPFDTVVDVPLVARHARRSAAETGQLLDLPSDRPVALLSFGRYGLGTIDWAAVGRDPDLTVIVTHDPVDSEQRVPSAVARNVFHLDMPALARRGIRYEDVVAAADVVFTKPGYGIIAECAANDTALVYTSRGDFAEYAVLVAAMPTLLRCAYLEQDDLYAGRWMPAVRRVLNQPRVERPRCDGAQVIARHLKRYV